MRQLRLAILAGIGILALCGVAIAVALSDYVSHPAVAVAHVPPVVGPGAPDPADTAPAQAPLPQTPVTAVPVEQAPPAQAQQQRQAPAQPVAQQNQDALARLLQQLQQRRHHPPR